MADGDAEVVTDVDAGVGNGGWGEKAQSPIRLWQRAQCSSDASLFALPDEGRGPGRAVMTLGAGVALRDEATDAERDGAAVDAREGITELERESEGITELERESEGARIRSGAGGARVHPKSAVKIAVSEGSGWGPGGG